MQDLLKLKSCNTFKDVEIGAVLSVHLQRCHRMVITKGNLLPFINY